MSDAKRMIKSTQTKHIRVICSFALGFAKLE